MDRFQEMLADLRSTFTKKIPGGLTDTADMRLQKTLRHYVGEVERVKGTAMDTLSLTYESMAKWYRKNLVPEKFESEVDPDTLFASLKPVDAKTTGNTERTGNTEKPGPKAAPFGFPELQKVAELPRVVPTPYVQQKDVLQPQEDVVKYRESEYNLIMNSKDRDWLSTATPQNRYGFTIQFNTNYRPQGFGINANIQTRLRNIIRIEFIKAILPVENLDAVVAPTGCYSVLGMPSINIIADEFAGNNYGTNNTIDKSLAICQYDSTWRSDHFAGLTASRGFALFIPKFMKAQRVYTPTPLANLQTLTFRIQDTQNNLLSTLPDSAALATIAIGNTLAGTSRYIDAVGSYIFIRSQIWFPKWSFSPLDKVLIQGNTFISGSQPAGSTEFVTWLQDLAGHSVVGVAYDASGSFIDDGSNAVGYSNWIIIQNRFVDPKSGSTGLNYFTGSALGDAQLGADLLHYPQEGAVLNLSRQVQLTVRIITREYDIGSNVRPDNV